MCGNHASDFRIIAYGPGSPPRVREPHHFLTADDMRQRITPACAGTTAFCYLRRCGMKDHPRVCGNHIDDGNRVTQRAGSPPRVREPR